MTIRKYELLLSNTIRKYEQLKKELMTLTNADQLIDQQQTKQIKILREYEQTLRHKVRRYDKQIRLVDLDKNRSNFNEPYQIRYSKQLLNVLLRSNDWKWNQDLKKFSNATWASWIKNQNWNLRSTILKELKVNQLYVGCRADTPPVLDCGIFLALNLFKLNHIHFLPLKSLQQNRHTIISTSLTFQQEKEQVNLIKLICLNLRSISVKLR